MTDEARASETSHVDEQGDETEPGELLRGGRLRPLSVKVGDWVCFRVANTAIEELGQVVDIMPGLQCPTLIVETANPRLRRVFIEPNQVTAVMSREEG